MYFLYFFGKRESYRNSPQFNIRIIYCAEIKNPCTLQMSCIKSIWWVRDEEVGPAVWNI